MKVYRKAVIDEKTCEECKRLHGVTAEHDLSEDIPLGQVDGVLLGIVDGIRSKCSNDDGCRCYITFGPSR